MILVRYQFICRVNDLHANSLGRTVIFAAHKLDCIGTFKYFILEARPKMKLARDGDDPWMCVKLLGGVNHKREQQKREQCERQVVHVESSWTYSTVNVPSSFGR